MLAKQYNESLNRKKLISFLLYYLFLVFFSFINIYLTKKIILAIAIEIKFSVA